MKNLFFTALLASLFIQGLQGSIWDEGLNGDLAPAPGASASSPFGSATVLTFDLGVNRVKGTMGGDPGDGIPLDRDIFTVTIPVGQQISSIEVLTYTPSGQSFYAISSGTTISLNNGATHLSNMLVKGSGQILPTLAAGAYNGGTGLSNPIPAGTYTIWFQETSSVVTYDFAYTVAVVPEPSTLALLAVALAGILTARKRFRRHSV